MQKMLKMTLLCSKMNIHWIRMPMNIVKENIDMPQWLKNAVFYEIYPQSFYDTNGDGIGDINGITQKLDYIKQSGFNALWLNPCYLSPFMDAGYDVQDYKQVAPRYGTNEDLYNLFDEAHKRGMHVILTSFPGTPPICTRGFWKAKTREKQVQRFLHLVGQRLEQTKRLLVGGGNVGQGRLLHAQLFQQSACTELRLQRDNSPFMANVLHRPTCTGYL